MELREDPVARVGTGGSFIIAIIISRQFRQVRLHIGCLDRGNDRIDLCLVRGAGRVCREVVKPSYGKQKEERRARTDLNSLRGKFLCISEISLVRLRNIKLIIPFENTINLSVFRQKKRATYEARLSPNKVQHLIFGLPHRLRILRQADQTKTIGSIRSDLSM